MVQTKIFKFNQKDLLDKFSKGNQLADLVKWLAVQTQRARDQIPQGADVETGAEVGEGGAVGGDGAVGDGESFDGEGDFVDGAED